jgi:hypothetical protein
MNEPAIRSSRSIAWLRFIVWVVPSCAVPFLLFVFLPGGDFTRGLALVFALGALIFLGRFDALLKCQQRQIPPDDSRARVVQKMVAFVVLQLVLVPALWGAIVLVSVAIWGAPSWGC